MPIYEYECTTCHNIIEAFQQMTEEPLCTCPDCSGSLKKLVSMSSFKLKGGGWYADGYSSNSSGSNNSAGKSNGNGNGNQVKADKSPATTSNKTDSANPSSSKKSSTAAA